MSRTAMLTSVGYTGPVGRERVTPPDAPLLRLEDVRARLRLPHDDEDVQLQDFLEAALDDVEAQLGRLLLPQTVRWWYDGLPCGDVVLPEPARAIVAVTTYATDDDTTGTVVDAGSYGLDAYRSRLLFTTSPSSGRSWNGVSIEAEVGYASAVAVPPALVQAVYLEIQGHYLRGSEPPGEGTARREAVTRLLAPHRFRMGVA